MKLQVDNINKIKHKQPKLKEIKKQKYKQNTIDIKWPQNVLSLL